MQPRIKQCRVITGGNTVYMLPNIEVLVGGSRERGEDNVLPKVLGEESSGTAGLG